MYGDSDRAIRDASVEELFEHLSQSPTSWQMWYEVGRQLLQDRHAANDKTGIACIERAIRCNPNSYQLWQGLYHAYMANGDFQNASRARTEAMSLREWLNIPPVPTEKEAEP